MGWLLSKWEVTTTLSSAWQWWWSSLSLSLEPCKIDMILLDCHHGMDQWSSDDSSNSRCFCSRTVTNRTATNGEEEDVLCTEKLCGSRIWKESRKLRPLYGSLRDNGNQQVWDVFQRSWQGFGCCVFPIWCLAASLACALWCCTLAPMVGWQDFGCWPFDAQQHPLYVPYC